MTVNGIEIKPGANLRGANLSEANLSEANLSEANLSEANLSGASLDQCTGLRYAQLSFSDFGEYGRLITLAEINNELLFYCGCFIGDEAKLIDYIDKTSATKKIKQSRIFAMETLLNAIEFSNPE